MTARLDSCVGPVEICSHDPASAFAALHRRLACYLGADAFRDLTLAFLSAGAQKLVDFLVNTPPWSRNLEIAEFARFELALTAACDGPPRPHLKHADIEAITPKKLDGKGFDVDPAAKRFQFRTNVTSLWSCIACEENPPKPERRREPVDVLIWRQGGGARFRILGVEEAQAFAAAAAGKSYADITAVVAGSMGSLAGERTRGYLRGWIEAELISALRNPVVSASAKK